MIQNSLKWGAIGGLGSIIIHLLFFIFSPYNTNSFVGFVTYLPVLFCMIYGGITYRQENDNRLSYGQAFVSVWVIAIAGSLLLNSFNAVIICRVLDPHHIDKIQAKVKEKQAEAMEKRGMTDEEIKKNLEMMDKFNFEALGYISSFATGLILSALIAIFVKRNPDAINSNVGGAV